MQKTFGLILFKRHYSAEFQTTSKLFKSNKLLKELHEGIIHIHHGFEDDCQHQSLSYLFHISYHLKCVVIERSCKEL